jgi:twitching motility protein PilT
MEKLNEFLQALVSASGYELHLEPESAPYVLSASGTTQLPGEPLLGTQISMMVFPLIPPDVKSELPDRDEVRFVHPHNLGRFSFVVKKTPAGFNVTVSPVFESSVNIDTSAQQPQVSAPASPTETSADPSIFEFESVANEVEQNASGELAAEEEQDAANNPLTDSVPEIVSANDPQFTTVFSDTAAYEPPAPRDEPGSENIFSPAMENVLPDPEPEAVVAPEFESLIEPPAAPLVDRRQGDRRKVDLVMVDRMDSYFKQMSEAGASDLHLSVSVPPMIRKDGKMQVLDTGDAAISAEVMQELLTSIMPEKNREEFARRHDTDFAYEITGLARFRCNVFMDRKGMGGVFRIIPSKILTAEDLGLSKAIMDLCSLSKWLVVVTGPAGSGKSTTLCAMVDSINKTREDHIITIEDPIEFVHENQKCLVNQREVHNHTDSFKDALRAALREDPDILLVGEMRDLETISIAIETAETGHLVFGTLHTTTAASTVDRIIDQFPADRQQQVRVMLSESLKGVIAQTLLPKKGGGRIAALEILIVTPAISNLIREGKTFQIPSSMQTGKNHGMVMLNDALFDLVKKGIVEPRDAYIKAVDKTGLETMFTREGIKL